MYKFFVLILSSFFALAVQSQSTLDGQVLDEHGEPLAFVSIVVNNGSTGALSDIDGRFQLSNPSNISKVEFRSVGFLTESFDQVFLKKHQGKKLKITLKPSESNLNEAIILAGENPADIIMRKVIQNRQINNPEKRPTYRCQTYNKVVFDMQPHTDVFEESIASKKQNAIRKKQGERFQEIQDESETRHLFLMETVTERAFLFPDQVQETILLNRTSGFENTGMVALANMVQPFSFYGDYLQILDKDYLNPVSPNSPERYFFSLIDTLTYGEDSTFIIEFHPRKGKVFEGLKGVLHINNRGWAVQNVQASPANPNPNIALKIEQAYRFQADFWFPEQLNFEFEFLKYPAAYVGLKASGKTYIDLILNKNEPEKRDFLPESPILMLPEAQTRDSLLWSVYHQKHPLNSKETTTYTILDSLGEKKKFDQMASALTILSTGLLPIYKNINLDLTKIASFNDAEGFRLGMGLNTAQAKPLAAKPPVETAVYGAYGFEDAQWKYGTSILWRFNQSRNTKFKCSASRDLEEPGALSELRAASLVNRRLYARRMDLAEAIELSLSSRLFKGGHGAFSAKSQQLTATAYGYQFVEENKMKNSFRFTETTAYFRFAFDEKSKQLFGSEINRVNRFPALEIAWTKGWEGVLRGEYAYNRWVLSLSQSSFIRRLGRFDWRIEAGLVNGNVPIQKLFTLNQGSEDFTLFALDNTFQTLNDTLWLSDRFVNLYLKQEIGPVLYRHKFSSPFLSVQHNFSVGALKNPEKHQNLGFTTALRPVQESGFRLDDLVKINYLNFAYIGLGGVVFYRWDLLDSTDWKDGLALRMSLRLSL